MNTALRDSKSYRVVQGPMLMQVSDPAINDCSYCLGEFGTIGHQAAVDSIHAWGG